MNTIFLDKMLTLLSIDLMLFFMNRLIDLKQLSPSTIEIGIGWVHNDHSHTYNNNKQDHLDEIVTFFRIIDSHEAIGFVAVVLHVSYVNFYIRIF